MAILPVSINMLIFIRQKYRVNHMIWIMPEAKYIARVNWVFVNKTRTPEQWKFITAWNYNNR